jgi:Ca2+-binding RTX toxin-like protein
MYRLTGAVIVVLAAGALALPAVASATSVSELNGVLNIFDSDVAGLGEVNDIDVTFDDITGELVVADPGPGVVPVAPCYSVDAGTARCPTITPDNLTVLVNSITADLGPQSDRMNLDVFTPKGSVNKVRGGSGDDLILGSDSVDLLSGGLGKDIVKGSEGNDTLGGGGGKDACFGGTGRDKARHDCEKVRSVP